MERVTREHRERLGEERGGERETERKKERLEDITDEREGKSFQPREHAPSHRGSTPAQAHPPLAWRLSSHPSDP